MHKLCDLVYHSGSLGYICEINEVKKNIYTYRISWFNRMGLGDYSLEWDDTLRDLKKNLEEYINAKSQSW